MATQPEISKNGVPSLPHGVELRFDPAEKAWTVSVPARIVMPDDITIEILKRCDGKTPIAAIVDELAQALLRQSKPTCHRCQYNAAGSGRSRHGRSRYRYGVLRGLLANIGLVVRSRSVV